MYKRQEKAQCEKSPQLHLRTRHPLITPATPRLSVKARVSRLQRTGYTMAAKQSVNRRREIVARTHDSKNTRVQNLNKKKDCKAEQKSDHFITDIKWKI